MIKIFIFSLITNLLFYSYGHLIKSTNVIDKIEGINNKSIYGVILISFLALTLNFFFPLNKEINTLILFSGLLILLSKRKFHLGKLEITYIVVSALITASLLLYSNINTPDAGLYHLPYINIISDSKVLGRQPDSVRGSESGLLLLAALRQGALLHALAGPQAAVDDVRPAGGAESRYGAVVQVRGGGGDHGHPTF